MRRSRGTAPTAIRCASISARGHNAPTTSAIISPSSSCRPSRVPPYAASIACTKRAGRCGLSRVAPRVSTVPGAAITCRINCVVRGVVVTSARGSSPSRNPISRLFHASTPFYLPSSSAQAR